MTRPHFFYLRIPLIIAVGLLGGSCGNSVTAPAVPATGAERLTVVVAVVDSLMPQEITAATTNLNSLKTGGTFYAESRSVFVAETIPNHVAMMTGVNPARSGIANNNFLDYAVSPLAEHDSSVPEELTANTLFTWIKRRCRDFPVNPDIRTSATLSKKYLFEIFEGDAADVNGPRENRNLAVNNVPPDTHWDPRTSEAYIPSPDEHTPDAPTMQQALTQPSIDADFMFINLGDVDRSAHAGGQAARSAALEDTDTQLGLLMDALQDRWENTVLFLVSDHGMDYSTPDSYINVQPTLDGLQSCLGGMVAIDNGGTDSIYLTDRSQTLADRQTVLRSLRACLLGTAPCDCGVGRPNGGPSDFGNNFDNIEFAWYTVDDPTDPAGTMPASLDSKHSNLGDLVLTAKTGFRFSEDARQSNPIPGNHGHPVTLRNTLIVSGGSPWVKQGQVINASIANPTVFDRLPEQSENVDIAPTVAWLLGLNLKPSDFPDGQGFDGRVLKEAFVQFDTNPDAASPTVCGRFD